MAVEIVIILELLKEGVIVKSMIFLFWPKDLRLGSQANLR